MFERSRNYCLCRSHHVILPVNSLPSLGGICAPLRRAGTSFVRRFPFYVCLMKKQSEIENCSFLLLPVRSRLWCAVFVPRA